MLVTFSASARSIFDLHGFSLTGRRLALDYPEVFRERKPNALPVRSRYRWHYYQRPAERMA
jgi:hypothetical protein